MKHKMPVLFSLLFGVSAWAVAAGPVAWVEPVDRLMQGSLDGVAVHSDGRLSLAPLPAPIASGGDLEGAGQGWSLAAGKGDALFIGTGPRGLVFRIDPSGKAERLADLEEPMVSALAVLDNGDLLAAGNPGGKIYKVAPDGTVTLWAELGERYIWSLAVASGGKIYAATGENGRIFQLDRRGTPEKFFDAPEPHIVSLAVHPDGGLIAGGAGGGRVYRIDEQGHGTILYDDELQEVTGVAVDGNGSILVSLMAARPAPSGPPAVRFHLPAEIELGSPSSRVDGLDQQEGAVVEGTIAGLVPSRPGTEPPVRGRVVRIPVRGNPVELWSSSREAAFSVGKGRNGEILFGAGEPAALYRVEQEDVTLLSRLKEGTVGSFAVRENAAAFLTSNPASVYGLLRNRSEPGVYLSPVLDAGRTARWGAVRWRADGAPGQVEFFARTGSSPSPDGTWTGWGPAMSRAASASLDEPPARYLQWRLRFPGGMADSARASVSGITIHYQPANRPPTLEAFQVETGENPAPGAVRLHWKTSDPDGDEVEVAVEFRKTGTQDWTAGFRVKGIRSSGALPGDLPEGSYQVRAQACDHLSNSWQDALKSRWAGPLSVTVDRTPPRVSVRKEEDGSWKVLVEDAASPLAWLKLLSGGEVRLLGHPKDGVVDGVRETFLLPPLVPDGGPWEIEAADAAGNVARAPL